VAEHRFFVPAGELPDAPERAILRGSEHHHLSRVLRLRPGAPVAVFDGEGRGFDGVLESVSREESHISLKAPDRRNVEPVFRVTLAQGIPAHDRMDLIIQKATEIGVWEIQPIVAERTTARVGSGPGWKRLERWRRIACEAARQSGRLRVPLVREPSPWDDYHAALPASAHDSKLVLCPEAPGGEPPARSSSSSGCIVAVGPEGGWTDQELRAALGRGFARLSLGPRVLRTETAGIVAVALLLFVAGELGGALKKPDLS